MRSDEEVMRSDEEVISMHVYMAKLFYKNWYPTVYSYKQDKSVDHLWMKPGKLCQMCRMETAVTEDGEKI